VIVESHDVLVGQWAAWINARAATAPSVPRPTLERELGVVLSLLAHMVGPHRHDAAPLWDQVAEHHGRMAAARGLAAGEVVEELHCLRELLIVELAPRLWRGRARAGLAITLRLNRILDHAVAIAVVGYTDMLVATMFAANGVPAAHGSFDAAELARQLDDFDRDLLLLDAAR
jgi:hypothetical protein